MLFPPQGSCNSLDRLLLECADVFPEDLPSKLPPDREVNICESLSKLGLTKLPIDSQTMMQRLLEKPKNTSIYGLKEH